MINILLEAYISESKKRKKSRMDIIMLVVVIITELALATIFSIFIVRKTLKYAIFAVSFLVAFFAFYFVYDKYDIKQYRIRFDEHNKKLDTIKSLLKQFKYNYNDNWYSSSKIKHLIQSGETCIEEYNKNNKKLRSLGRTILLAVVSLLANIVSNYKWLLIAFVVLFLTAFIEISFGFLLSITDLLYKSSSVKEMKKLVHLLKDLHARDFS